MSKQPRKPRIVRLDEKKPVVQSVADRASQEKSTRKPTAQNDLSLVTEQTDDDQAFDNPEILPSQPVSSGFSWGKLLLGALAGLASPFRYLYF